MPDRCLLYYITDRTAFAGDEPTRRRRLLEKISEAARAGVDYIQLREKDLTTRDLESLAREVVRVIRDSPLRTENRELRTALLINSRTDVSLAAGAQGVHLRSDDISPQEVRAVWRAGAPGSPVPAPCGEGTLTRQLLPPAPLIAVSCHSLAEVTQAAEAGATFAFFAPIFEKKEAEPVGRSARGQACQAKISVLALGGVTLANARSCLEAGAAGIAAIRLFQDNDIASIVHQLRSNA